MPLSRSELLYAYRWPAALVLASLVLGGVALKLLSQPIPIRIQGGLDVDRLVMPASITIRADRPLPVDGIVAVRDDVQITAEAPLPIRGPLSVREIQAPVKVTGAVKADAMVQAIQSPVDLVTSAPLSVKVEESVNVDGKVSIRGKVDIEGKVGANVKPQLLPLP
ncbi:MAG: hypothetical protein CL862_10870 [Cyanobium sp. NAT70]|nr:hypothetical protein [Cyanobium sp. NAT70]|tara:strand:- start:311 stop:805 length:495 start_codon:yes stop_codon:yes gene_type:complete